MLKSYCQLYFAVKIKAKVLIGLRSNKTSNT